MKKILIVTSTVDFTVDYIINKYKDKCDFFRVNVDNFDKYEFDVNFEDGFSIKNKHWYIRECEITAIYYRKPMLPDLSGFESGYIKMISKDIIYFINGLVDSFKGKVLSKPSDLRKSENKIYQIKIAREVNFHFPESSVGTCKEKINEIIKKGGIIKPLTTGKVISDNLCEIIQTSEIKSLVEEDISLTPLYIQKYINKDYELRITIVNDKVFPVKIIPCNEIDWRIEQEKNKYSLISVPSQIEDKCFEMLKRMNLKFGAFDFVINKSGEYIFLEVNPNGQWLWLEEKLNLNISDEIVNYLLEE